LPKKSIEITMAKFPLKHRALDRGQGTRGIRDKGQGTRDKGQETRDKGQGTRDEGQGTRERNSQGQGKGTARKELAFRIQGAIMMLS
jgi:hypothetical protein